MQTCLHAIVLAVLPRSHSSMQAGGRTSQRTAARATTSSTPATWPTSLKCPTERQTPWHRASQVVSARYVPLF
jgi:hypothetical protein